MELKPGYKQTEVGVIPEDWDVDVVGNSFEICNQLRLPISNTARERMAGPYPYYGPTGIQGRINEYRVNGKYALIGEDGDHFLKWQSQSMTLLVEGKFNVNNHAHLVCGKANQTEWFYWYFSNRDITPHLTRQGAGRFKLTKASLLQIPCPLPSQLEQRNISKVLSDINTLIGSLEELTSKKRDIKQAAMQELLTGKRRLPGFEGAWEETTVKDVVTRSFCGPSPTCQERNIEGDDEWGVLKTTAITWENGWSWRAHKLLPASYWGKSEIELRQGDVLVTKAGPRHRVGVSAWIDQIPQRIIPSGKMIALRPNPKRAEPLMLAAAIASRSTQAYLDQRTTGMAESQVNFENAVLLSAPITLPSIAEQAAISEICAEFDKELKDLEAKITAFHHIKEGMMQQLLTGKIRLQ